MEAGKTSFNTRQKAVLTAILSQATKRLTDPTEATVITSAQRDNIVTALFNITSAQPLIRKTDLLAQLVARSNSDRFNQLINGEVGLFQDALESLR